MWTRERRLALFSARLFLVILVLSILVGLWISVVSVYLAFEIAAGTDLEGVITTITLPVKLAIAESAYSISFGRDIQLSAEHAGIGLPSAVIPRAIHFFFTLIIPCVYAFYVYVIFCLQKMFASFAAGRPFQSASVHALRLVAWVLIVQYVIGQSTRLLSYWLLTRVEVSGAVSVSPPALFGTSAELSLATGVTLLLIAWAFGRAAVIEQERDTLQQEQDLTI